MTFDVKNINSATISATFEISKDELAKQVQIQTNKVAKTAKIAGFRVGKVPAYLIQSRFGESIQNEARNALLQDGLKKVLADLQNEGKKNIGEPFIKQVTEDVSPEIALKIETNIALIPEFSLDKLDSCIPTFSLDPIKEEEINARLDDIVKSNHILVDVTEDRALQNDDVALFDFEGFVNNKAFEGGKGENFELHIGSKQFIPGFEEGMIGLKKGEQRDINVTFPSDYNAKHLAGKNAVFKIKLHAIKQKQDAKLDDELAKKLLPNIADATVANLKDEVKNNLQNEAKNKLYNETLKPKLIENILSNITFDLPQSIIEQEIDILLRNSLNALNENEAKQLTDLRDSDPEAFNKDIEKRREAFRQDASNSVQLTFIIDAFAKQEKVQISDQDLFNTIYYEAIMSGQNPNELLERYKQNGLLPALKMAILEDRILHILLDKNAPKSSEN
ncbi:MAG: trigger factor [Helicobacter sp.]|nr:trigger factor [Helicobacter sp.]